MPETFHTVELISVERIRANDYNPNAMAAKTYEQLVASIKGRGFRSAIYVLPADQDGVHTIVDGEHRWRAAKESGLLHVPCVVLPANQDEAMMDTIAMNDAAYVILHWFDLHHVRWNFVKGWTPTPNIRSTNARMDYVWLDLPELPHSR